MVSAVLSTCSLFSWMHRSPCVTEKSPLEEIGSGLWMCIINCATGQAARAVLCRGQQLQWVTAPLSFVGRAGHEVRPSHTLWRSGRKLPPGNIPKSQYHHPKESKEETAVALPAPQVPFCWSEIQRAWWEVAIWIQAVCYPSQQIILPAQPTCYQSLYTRAPAGVQCVQWEIPHF